MWQLIKRFSSDEANATTEYGVCLALIVLASIGAITFLGESIKKMMPDLAELFS